MGSAGILFVRRAISDVTIHNDQRRSVLAILKRPERTAERLEIIRVADTGHIPAVSDKPRRHVLSEVRAVLPSIVMWLLS